ncbi:phosphohydrolase [Pedobacter sp. PACM 27299]|uniref:HD domain-containing protein n=1 Tax=Pedobacter sp. PACM 27299 TaxID=1727164 RepID=UPI0007059855|nr:HD domain-containing protein [Pedobacter sp. PACM 27299]ALL06578.1 phosphohydrolase [Pedobacter sp. PACM 27299]
MITVNDLLYGNVELPAVFDDLLASPALKRLGGVHQSGAIFLVNPELCHTRLEHSIGVMLLIRKLGGSELEQIAGLLHDASHTAFSHVGDYVFKNKEENYHEEMFAEILMNSDIPAVLQKHGYQLDQILDGTFPLLEQPLPDLCADRLDYTLRDALHAGLINRPAAKLFLEHIRIQEGRIVVTNEEQVNWINEVYERLKKEVFELPLHLYANQQMAVLIRDFLRNGFLQEADLFKDDTFLLNKIRSFALGYEAVKSIKTLKGYPTFLKNGSSLTTKLRNLKAMLSI